MPQRTTIEKTGKPRNPGSQECPARQEHSAICRVESGANTAIKPASCPRKALLLQCCVHHWKADSHVTEDQTSGITLSASCHISEVLLLDLTTPKKRAVFFGLNGANTDEVMLAATVEIFIAKFVPEN